MSISFIMSVTFYDINGTLYLVDIRHINIYIYMSDYRLNTCISFYWGRLRCQNVRTVHLCCFFLSWSFLRVGTVIIQNDSCFVNMFYQFVLKHHNWEQ